VLISKENVMAKAIHMMIRVLDEARSVDFYRRALGFEIAERLAFDSFTLVYLKGEGTDFELELTINHGRSEPYDLGNGYGHLAVCVDDLEAEHARMREAGITLGDIKDFYREGALLARFFFITDPDGYKTEVVQRHGRYR
jgi:lactoylglutathione lyase